MSRDGEWTGIPPGGGLLSKRSTGRAAERHAQGRGPCVRQSAVGRQHDAEELDPRRLPNATLREQRPDRSTVARQLGAELLAQGVDRDEPTAASEVPEGPAVAGLGPLATWAPILWIEPARGRQW